jgi:hypothetical protein
MLSVEVSMTRAAYEAIGESDVRRDLRWMAKRDYKHEGNMIFSERYAPYVTKSGHKCTIVYIRGEWSNDN